MRSAASLPESLRATLRARAWNGAMIRSANDSSYSLVSSLGALVSAWTRATERSTPETVCPEAVVPMAAETSRSASTTRAAPRIKKIVMSHLDLDDARHPEDADREDHHATDEHRDAHGSGEQHDHVVVVGEKQVAHEGRRQT